MNNIVNLWFPVKGEYLYADQNHRLLASLSQKCPAIHQIENLAINTIAGIPDQEGKIALTRNSKLLIRLPVEAIAQVYALAGQTLTIGSYAVKLGNPELQTLQAVDSLKARLVIIKGYTEPQSFLEAAQRQLEALEIEGRIGIPANAKGEPKRLTLKINKAEQKRSYTIVGFSVVVDNLTSEAAIKLQAFGLGGKRRLGCGVFYPKNTVLNRRRMRHAEETFS